MVNNWKHLNFFDKGGKYLNFDYDPSEDKWSGTMYLPEVSIGLFEVGQIFILEEFVNKNTNLKEFGFPHGIEVATGKDIAGMVIDFIEKAAATKGTATRGKG